MKIWGWLLLVAPMIVGCLVPVMAEARIYVGNGMYCDLIIPDVDGEVQGGYFDNCVFDGGGGGGGGATPPQSPPPPIEPPVCHNLKRQRPNDCLNRTSMPSSSEFGATHYNLSSALGRALGLRNVLKPFRTSDPNFPASIDAALRTQTEAIATLIKEERDVDQNFLNSIKAVCGSVHRHYDVLRARGGIFAPDSLSEQEWACYNTEVQIAREMNSQSIVGTIVTAITNLTGFDPSALIPYSLISASDPNNSLHQKFRLVTKDAKCASWWNDMDENGCISP